jgi:hypothetical protein
MKSCPVCEGSQSNLRHPSVITSGPCVWRLCGRCGGGWQEPYQSELQLQNADVSKSYGSYFDQACFQKVAREKLAWVITCVPGLKRIIELGPGSGAFGLEAMAAGYSYLGIEPHGEFASRLGNLGLPVLNVSAENFLAAMDSHCSGQPCIVFMDNVLEHIPYPAEFVRRLCSYLPSGSAVFIEVPNETGLRWRGRIQDFVRGHKKPPTFPGHINLFTPRGMNLMLSRLDRVTYCITRKGIRNPEHIHYLSLRRSLNLRTTIALMVLRLVPIDRLLRIEYWLRVRIEKN